MKWLLSIILTCSLYVCECTGLYKRRVTREREDEKNRRMILTMLSENGPIGISEFTLHHLHNHHQLVIDESVGEEYVEEVTEVDILPWHQQQKKRGTP